jgi:hypothetical protein
MLSVNSQQIFNISQAEDGKFIKLDTTNMPELSGFPQGAYALLTVPVSELDGSSDGRYQDTPFSTQLSTSASSSSQITSADYKGWLTISVDPESSDVVYVGSGDVTSTVGYKLSSALHSITVSSDQLSEWHVIGSTGSETVFVCGAYIEQ